MRRERIFISKAEAMFLDIPPKERWIYRKITDKIQPTKDSRKRGRTKIIGSLVSVYFGCIHQGKVVIKCWRIETIQHPEKGSYTEYLSDQKNLKKTKEIPFLIGDRTN